jgi:hypothetical protein
MIVIVRKHSTMHDHQRSSLAIEKETFDDKTKLGLKCSAVINRLTGFAPVNFMWKLMMIKDSR